MFTPKKILVPTDFSEFSDNALAQAVDIARQYKSTIYLLHVLVVQEYAYYLPGSILEDIRRESIKSAQKMIQQQVEKIGKPNGVEIVTDIREGIPVYEEILEEQKAKDIDLIVIASHGTTGLLHHLIGSVADKVTKSATCPVYLVRGPK
jgi:nucleotide-binding universal stress UspA family protein